MSSHCIGDKHIIIVIAKEGKALGLGHAISFAWNALFPPPTSTFNSHSAQHAPTQESFLWLPRPGQFKSSCQKLIIIINVHLPPKV